MDGNKKDDFTVEIPENIKTAIALLEASSFEAYVVGGCVRDCIMGVRAHDWDVTTSATPEQIKSVFFAYKTVDVGIKHGTVVVVIGSENVEITSFRIDGEYTDSRHPDSVRFTTRLELDLARRDFTMNAVAYSPSRGITDPFGGVEDIKNRVIRCVGNPDERLREDALRIMRCIRFASVLGFDVHADTERAVIANAGLLADISKERISQELIKLLLGKDVFPVLLKFKSVIAVPIPELSLEFGFKQHGAKHAYDVFTHTALTVSLIEPDALLRLTMLLHDCGKPATHSLDENGCSVFKNHAAVGEVIARTVLRRLKMKNEYVNKASFLVGIHDMKVPSTREQIKEYLYKLGEEDFIRLMKIRRADTGALAEGYNNISQQLIFAYGQLDEIMKNGEPYSVKQLAVSGKDVKRLVPDEKIGECLDMLVHFVIERPSANTRDELLDRVRLMYGQ